MAMPLALIWDLIARDQASPTFARVGAAAATTAKSTDRASAAVTRSGAAMGRASSGFRTLTGVSAKLGFAIGGVAAIVESFKVGQQFQKQMLQIQTLTGGSATEVTNMSKALLSLAGQVATGPNELATSLYHVESVGLRGAKALDVVKIAAEGAKVGMADVEQTTNALTSTVASGIPGVQNMSQAMGALVTIVGAGDMKLSDLNAALGGGILSVVKGYGLSLTDVGAALATFGDNNIRGADAATALRMAVQSLAVPAARGKDAIESIGLSMTTLQKDMQEGGLNKALLDLNAHMKKAGITSIATGAYLTEAFGKRAGIGLSVLMNQIDRFEQKTRAVQEGAGSFGDKWEATTHTVGFAFDRIGAQLQALGVRAFEKAGPGLTKVADLIGVTLPHAISTAGDTLHPLINTVQGAFVAAWHAAAAVLPPVAHALGDILGFAARHGVLLDMAEAVTALWVAFKGYTIATVALKAVFARGGLVDGARLRLMLMAESGTLALGAVGALTIGFYAAGKAIAGWEDRGKAALPVLQSLKQNTDEWRDSLVQSNGALTDNIKLSIAKELQDSGLASKAAAAGISLRDLTAAVAGNDRGFQGLISRWKSSGKPSDDTLLAISALHGGYRGAASSAKALATVTGTLSGAQRDSNGTTKSLKLGTQGLTQFQKDLAAAQKETHLTLDGTTYAMRAQSSAADILSAAIARLSGDKNAVAESQLAFRDAMAGLTAQIKQNGTSLDENTKKGRSNLEWMHQQIDAINSTVSAQIKNRAGAQKVTDTLGAMESVLRKNAIAHGFNATQIERLIKDYAATPKKVETEIRANADPATTKALALKAKLDDLVKQRTAVIKAGSDPTALRYIQEQLFELTRPRTVPVTPVLTRALPSLSIPGGPITAQAAGTSDVPQGYSTTGERGWELLHRTGNQVAVIPHGAARAMTGLPSRLPGFASGTKGSTKDYVVQGQHYSTRKDADTALAKAVKTIAHALNHLAGHELKRLGKALGKTGSDVRDAFGAVRDSLREIGLSHKAIHRLTVEDNKLARKVDIRNRDMDKLNSLIQSRRQESRSIGGAVRGSFDIASAGAGPSGSGKPSFGTIYAQAIQDKNLVKKWAAGIKKLGRAFGASPVGKAMLRRLAEAGPDSWPQVSALLAANPKQLANLVATQRQIAQTGRSVGGYVSGRLYDERIHGARATVRDDRRAVLKEWRELRHDLREVADRPVTVHLTVDGKVLATAVATGDNRNGRRK